MHTARLRRGGSLDARHPPKSIHTLLGSTRHGFWTVLGEGRPYERPLKDGKPDPSGRHRTAHCRCICGVERDVPIHTLKQGNSRHCGCLVPAMTAAKNKSHGMSASREYAIWCKMRDRCSNPENRDFPKYGGRGIEVCEAWQGSFEQFYSDIGPRPSPRHSIDRIDVNGNYEPGNVRWATPREQQQNKTTNVYVELNGQKLALREACRRLRRLRDYRLIQQRMRKYGKSFAEAIAL